MEKTHKVAKCLEIQIRTFHRSRLRYAAQGKVTAICHRKSLYLEPHLPSRTVALALSHNGDVRQDDRPKLPEDIVLLMDMLPEVAKQVAADLRKIPR
jgi:hypothetical protein